MSKKIDDSNVVTVTPKLLSRVLMRNIRTRRPCMVWGSPGTGKSDIIMQLAKALARPVIDIRLILMDPTDLKGIPYFNPESHTMEYAHPSELPKADGPLKNAIIFLDELVSATPVVQGSAYQLIHNRRVGEYVLPEGVDIIAAGNYTTDNGVAYPMPSPLANRFTHYNLVTNFEDWQEWALGARIHPSVIGFLTAFPGSLYDFNPKNKEKAFATGRTWEFVSQYLYDAEEHGDSPEEMSAVIAGTIGSGMASNFMSHLRLTYKLPKAMDVLDGKVLSLDSEDISVQYAFGISLVALLSQRAEAIGSDGMVNGKKVKLTVKHIQKDIDTVIGFLMANNDNKKCGVELLYLMGRIILTGVKIAVDVQTPNWTRFAKDFITKYQ